MKNAGFLIVLIGMLMMGCSKEELKNDTAENSQLKRGSTVNAGVSSLSFNGNSIVGESYPLIDLGDGSKILKNGKCSGSITGYGKIDPTFSDYSFYPPVRIDNIDYKSDNRQLQYDYILSGNGTVYLNARDYFTFTIDQGLYNPVNYEPGFMGIPINEPVFHGAIFGCPLRYWELISEKWTLLTQGNAYIIDGYGKFRTFKGRQLQIEKVVDTKGINRDTGEMKLKFTIL